MPEVVAIVGLKDFNKALKDMHADLPKAVRMAFNRSADIVVQAATPLIPKVSGAAVGSVRVASTRTAARVRAGGRKAPYYPWLDFGGNAGRGRSLHRPFIPDGRYVYHAFFHNRAEFVDVMSSELQAIAKHAGLELG